MSPFSAEFEGGWPGGEESSWVAEGVGPYLGWAVPEHEPPADARLLAAYLRPERRAIAALTAILVVAMVLPLAGGVLVGRSVDAASAGEATRVLITLGVIFLITALAGDGLQL